MKIEIKENSVFIDNIEYVKKQEEGFKANDYVVIIDLGKTTSKSFSLNKVYQLNKDFTPTLFEVKKDNEGDLNGFYGGIHGIQLIKAIPEEIEAYNKSQKKTYTLVNGDVVEEGDEVYWVFKENYKYFSALIETIVDFKAEEQKSRSQFFKTEKEADQWILDNKPRISYDDIRNFCIENNKVNLELSEIILNFFKKYA